MNLACAPDNASLAENLHGPQFLHRAQRRELSEQLDELGYTIARVVTLVDDEQPTTPFVVRGCLREAIDGAVEIALARRGALPPAVDVGADADITALDQLFRVRHLGSTGLCIVLPGLTDLADADGVLGTPDSQALELWGQLATTEPVILLFDAVDHGLSLLSPQSLRDVFDDPTPASTPTSRGWLAEPVTQRDGAPPTPPPVNPTDMVAAIEDVPLKPVRTPRRSMGTSIIPKDPLAGLELFDEQDFFDEENPHGDFFARPNHAPDDPKDALLASAPHQASLFDRIPIASPEATVEAEHDEVRSESCELIREQDEIVDEPNTNTTCTLALPDHLHLHIEALQRAQGPKSVRAIEQLFSEHYSPLLDAIGNGCQHQVVTDAVAEWRQSFEKSYSEGYTTMRVTGRRPTMVLDMPDIATRVARANGARSVQLLLVDSMRFDLGRQVAARLHERIGKHAVCVDETLLWSALPTLTPTQIRLLARGPRGLREKHEEESERNALVHRERSVTTLRRIRIGPRNLIKLDVVEARLREAGPSYGERLHGLANEVASVIECFAQSLAPRTMLAIFGDHGFRLAAGTTTGTGPGQQGGASPEEVLVPSHCWLTGDVH